MPITRRKPSKTTHKKGITRKPKGKLIGYRIDKGKKTPLYWPR